MGPYLDVILLFVSAPSTFILQIPIIKKFLDLTESILCVSEIRELLEFIQYSTKNTQRIFHVFFFADNLYKKTIMTDTMIFYTRQHLFLRQCYFEKLFITVFIIFNVIGF